MEFVLVFIFVFTFAFVFVLVLSLVSVHILAFVLVLVFVRVLVLLSLLVLVDDLWSASCISTACEGRHRSTVNIETNGLTKLKESQKEESRKNIKVLISALSF